MRWVIAAIGIVSFGQSSWACTCVQSGPPSHAEVKQYVEWLMSDYPNVVRVRAVANSSLTEPMQESVVVEAWKGRYTVGDVLKVRSLEVSSCDTAVFRGDELLVAFESTETANFTNVICHDRYARRRAELERRYLRKLLRGKAAE